MKQQKRNFLTPDNPFVAHMFLDKYISSEVGNDHTSAISAFRLVLGNISDAKEYQRTMMDALNVGIILRTTVHTYYEKSLKNKKDFDSNMSAKQKERERLRLLYKFRHRLNFSRQPIIIITSGSDSHAVSFLVNTKDNRVSLINTGQGLRKYHSRLVGNGNTILYNIVRTWQFKRTKEFTDTIRKLVVDSVNLIDLHLTLDRVDIDTFYKVTKSTMLKYGEEIFSYAYPAFSTLMCEQHEKQTNIIHNYLLTERPCIMYESQFFATPQITGTCTFHSIMWALFCLVPKGESVKEFEKCMRTSAIRLIRPQRGGENEEVLRLLLCKHEDVVLNTEMVPNIKKFLSNDGTKKYDNNDTRFQFDIEAKIHISNKDNDEPRLINLSKLYTMTLLTVQNAKETLNHLYILSEYFHRDRYVQRILIREQVIFVVNKIASIPIRNDVNLVELILTLARIQFVGTFLYNVCNETYEGRLRKKIKNLKSASIELFSDSHGFLVFSKLSLRIFELNDLLLLNGELKDYHIPPINEPLNDKSYDWFADTNLENYYFKFKWFRGMPSSKLYDRIKGYVQYLYRNKDRRENFKNVWKSMALFETIDPPMFSFRIHNDLLHRPGMKQYKSYENFVTKSPVGASIVLSLYLLSWRSATTLFRKEDDQDKKTLYDRLMSNKLKNLQMEIYSNGDATISSVLWAMIPLNYVSNHSLVKNHQKHYPKYVSEAINLAMADFLKIQEYKNVHTVVNNAETLRIHLDAILAGRGISFDASTFVNFDGGKKKNNGNLNYKYSSVIEWKEAQKRILVARLDSLKDANNFTLCFFMLYLVELVNPKTREDASICQHIVDCLNSNQNSEQLLLKKAGICWFGGKQKKISGPFLTEIYTFLKKNVILFKTIILQNLRSNAAPYDLVNYVTSKIIIKLVCSQAESFTVLNNCLYIEKSPSEASLVLNFSEAPLKEVKMKQRFRTSSKYASYGVPTEYFDVDGQDKKMFITYDEFTKTKQLCEYNATTLTLSKEFFTNIATSEERQYIFNITAAPWVQHVLRPFQKQKISHSLWLGRNGDCYIDFLYGIVRIPEPQKNNNAPESYITFKGQSEEVKLLDKFYVPSFVRLWGRNLIEDILVLYTGDNKIHIMVCQEFSLRLNQTLFDKKRGDTPLVFVPQFHLSFKMHNNLFMPEIQAQEDILRLFLVCVVSCKHICISRLLWSVQQIIRTETNSENRTEILENHLFSSILTILENHSISSSLTFVSDKFDKSRNHRSEIKKRNNNMIKIDYGLQKRPESSALTLSEIDDLIICVDKFDDQKLTFGTEFYNSLKTFDLRSNLSQTTFQTKIDSIRQGIVKHASELHKLSILDWESVPTNVLRFLSWERLILLTTLKLRDIWNKNLPQHQRRLVVRDAVYRLSSKFTSLPDIGNTRSGKLFEVSGKFVNLQQDYLLQKMYSDLKRQKSRVHQAIMGIGKSSVIMPNLVIYALETLNVQTVIVVQPSHLVDPAFEIILKTFMSAGQLFTGLELWKIDSYKLPKPVEGIQQVLVISAGKFKHYILHRRINNLPDMLHDPKQTMIIYDEIDAMIDPMSSQLNVTQDETTPHPYDKIKDDMPLYYQTVCNLVDKKKAPKSFGRNYPMLHQKLLDDFNNAIEMPLWYKYGPSKKPDNYFAIPYISSRTPDEMSSFSDVDILCILSYMMKKNTEVGLKEQEIVLIRNDFKQYTFLEEKELLNAYFDTISEVAPTLREEKNDPFHFFLNSELKQCHKIFKNDQKLIRYYMEYIFFPKHVRVYKKRFNISFIDAMAENIATYKIGFSGTVNMNIPISLYPGKDRPDSAFDTNISTSNFAKDYIQSVLEMSLLGKNELVSYADNIDAIFQTMAHLKCNCLIDAAAVFRNLTTREVCNKIKNINQEIAGSIISFDTNDVPTIIDTGSGTKHYYYFDQTHSRGTDLKMDIETRGLVILDFKYVNSTIASQAAFRLRGLHHGQTVRFVIYDSTLTQDKSHITGQELKQQLDASEDKGKDIRDALFHIQNWKASTRCKNNHTVEKYSEKTPYRLNPTIFEKTNLDDTRLYKQACEDIKLIESNRVLEQERQQQQHRQQAQVQELNQEQEMEYDREYEVSNSVNMCMHPLAAGVYTTENIQSMSYITNQKIKKALSRQKITLSPLFLLPPQNNHKRVYSFDSNGHAVLSTLIETLAFEDNKDYYTSKGEKFRVSELKTQNPPIYLRLLVGGNLNILEALDALKQLGDKENDVKTILNCFIKDKLILYPGGPIKRFLTSSNVQQVLDFYAKITARNLTKELFPRNYTRYEKTFGEVIDQIREKVRLSANPNQTIRRKRQRRSAITNPNFKPRRSQRILKRNKLQRNA